MQRHNGYLSSFASAASALFRAASISSIFASTASFFSPLGRRSRADLKSSRSDLSELAQAPASAGSIDMSSSHGFPPGSVVEVVEAVRDLIDDAEADGIPAGNVFAHYVLSVASHDMDLAMSLLRAARSCILERESAD